MNEISFDCNKGKRGWWCSRALMHEGPCALRPHWWNVSKYARRYRKGMKI